MNKEIGYFLIALLLILSIICLYKKENLTNNTTLFAANPTTGEIEFRDASDVFSYVDNKIAEIDTSGPEFTISDVDEKIVQNNNTVQSKIDTDIKVPESRYLLKTTFNTFKNSGGYLHNNFIKKNNPYSVTVTQTDGVSKYTFAEWTEPTATGAPIAPLPPPTAPLPPPTAAPPSADANAVQNFKIYVTNQSMYSNPFGFVSGNRHVLRDEMSFSTEAATAEYNRLPAAEKTKYSSVPNQYPPKATDRRRQQAYIWYLYTMAKIVNPSRGYVDFYNNNATIRHIINNWSRSSTTYKLRGSQSDMTKEGEGVEIAKKDVEDYIGVQSNEERAIKRFNNYKKYKNLEINQEWNVIEMQRPDSRGGPTVSPEEIFDTLARYITPKQQAEYDKEKTNVSLSDEQKRQVRHMADVFIEIKRGGYRNVTYDGTFSEFVKPVTGGYYVTNISNGKSASQWWAGSPSNISWKARYNDNGERADPWMFFAKKSLYEILKFEFTDAWINKLNSGDRAAKRKIIEDNDPNYKVVENDPALKQFLAVKKIPELRHDNYIVERKKVEGNTWVRRLIEAKTFERGRHHYNAYQHTKARYRNNDPPTNSTNTWYKVRAERVEREKATENAKYNNFGFSQFYPWLTEGSMNYSASENDKAHREATDKEDERWETLWGRVWKPYFEKYCGETYKNNKKPEYLQKYLYWDFDTKKLIDKITYDNKTKLWSDYKNSDWFNKLKNKGIIPNTRYFPRSSCPGR